MVDTEKLKNFFLWMSIVFFIGGGIGSYYAINKIYESTFPYSTSIFWKDVYKVDVVCGSIRDYEVPVFGDYFSCNVTAFDLNLSDEYPINKTANYVKALILHYPKSERLEEPEWEVAGSSIFRHQEETSELYDIRVPIEPGFNEFQLEFLCTYLNEENRAIDYIFHSRFIKYEAISLEEYNRRLGEKYTLMFTIAALVIMFSFIGVRNLMAIWDRKP